MNLQIPKWTCDLHKDSQQMRCVALSSPSHYGLPWFEWSAKKCEWTCKALESRSANGFAKPLSQEVQMDLQSPESRSANGLAKPLSQEVQMDLQSLWVKKRKWTGKAQSRLVRYMWTHSRWDVRLCHHHQHLMDCLDRLISQLFYVAMYMSHFICVDMCFGAFIVDCIS